MPYNEQMYSFIETKLFSRLVVQYLTDEEYSKLQSTLIEDPEAAISFLVQVEYANCGGE